jgi:chaperonin GroEL
MCIHVLNMRIEWKWQSVCLQVTVSKDDTVILDGAGDKKAIEERAELVCSMLN